MKKEQGVSLIQLIITIILIVVISSFAIWYSSNTSTEAKLVRLYAEISAVKDSYENAMNLNEISSERYPIESLFETTAANSLKSTYSGKVDFIDDYNIENSETLYIVTPSNAKNIELEKLVSSYVIQPGNGNIYIIGGFSRNGGETKVYEYKDIVNLYKSTLR